MTKFPPPDTERYRHPRGVDLHPSAPQILPWRLTADQGLIQGPLDLGFLRGKILDLELAAEQVALHVKEGKLLGVFLDGRHALRIGGHPGELDVDSQLIFLCLDVPLSGDWRGGEAALWITTSCGEQERVGLLGGWECLISMPASFHDVFLRHGDVGDLGFITRLVDGLIRSRLEREVDRVRQTVGGSVAPLAGLADLAASALDPVLSPYGLRCRRLEARPQVEATSAADLAGHSDAAPVNRGP